MIEDLLFLISDELDVIEGYEAVIAKTTNPVVKKKLEEIRDDEKEHIKELSNLLLNI